MTRLRSRQAETEDVVPRRLKRGAVKTQHIDEWAVTGDKIRPGQVGDTHLHPTAIERIREVVADAAHFGETITLTGATMDGDSLVWSDPVSGVGTTGFEWLTLPTSEIGTGLSGYYTVTLELELADETGATVEVWAEGMLKDSFTGPDRWQFLDAHVFHLGAIVPTDVEVRVAGGTSVAHRVTVELVDVAETVDRVFSLVIAGGLSPAVLAVTDVSLFRTDGDLSSRAAMPAPRADAGVFGIDGAVHVAGGMTTGEDSASPSLYRYDPATDAWAARASMSTSRRQPASATVDGIGYVFGGANQSGVGGISAVLDTCEKYDPGTNAWSAVTAMPGGARNHHRAAVVDGLIHVIGGNTTTAGAATDRHEIYDPATGLWSTGAPLNAARWGFAIGVHDGRIFVCGGSVGVGSDITSVEVYDPTTDEWTAGPDMPATATYAGHATIGTTLVILEVAAVYVLDMATGEWTTIKHSSTFPTVPAVALI